MSSRELKDLVATHKASVAVYETQDGIDVEVRAIDGYVDETGQQAAVIHFRSEWPRIGDVVTCDRVRVLVADRRIDDAGNVTVRDEDTGAWFAWRA